MPMKTIEGYSKEKYTDTSVLLAGGGAKALSDFIGSLTWDSTNKKIQYTPVGGNATDLVTLSWDNIAGKPSLAAESHEHGAGDITSGTLAIARGGTNKSTWTKYGIVYASNANVLGQISVPTWAASTTYWLKAVTNASKVPTYSLATLSKSDVGLGNVDNTADANKSVLYAATSGDSNTVDAHHVTTAGSLPYKFSNSVTLASGSITGDYWYVTLSFTGRSYIWELTKSIITANYSNKQGQFYLNTYEYTGTWFGFSTAYNGSNLVSIALKSQNKPIYYLKLRKPVTYNGSVPDGVVEVKSTYDFTLTAYAKAPSGVTFVDINVPGFTNLSIPWGSLTGLPTSFTPATHEHSTADITSGTLGVARGGTGLSTIAIYSILYASAANTLSALGPNTANSNKFLRMKGTGSAGAAPTWAAVDWADLSGKPSTFTAAAHNHAAGDITSGTLGVARGGTGKASWTQYGLVYASATTTLAQVSQTWAASKTYWLKAVTNASKVPTYSFVDSLTSDKVTITYDSTGTDYKYVTFTDRQDGEQSLKAHYNLEYIPAIGSLQPYLLNGYRTAGYGVYLCRYYKSGGSSTGLVTAGPTGAGIVNGASALGNFTGTDTKVEDGKHTITLTNGTKSYWYVWPVLQVHYNITGSQDDCMEFGWANFYDSSSTGVKNVSPGGTVSFTFCCGRIHCQGSWAARDYVRLTDTPGITITFFGSQAY